MHTLYRVRVDTNMVPKMAITLFDTLLLRSFDVSKLGSCHMTHVTVILNQDSDLITVIL